MDSDDPSPPSAKIDTTVPVSARIWNYWLGGKDYYPVDKEAGDQFAQIYPGIFDGARAPRYFIARVTRYLAGEAGIRQFLDIGTGLPSQDNTHEIAQQVAPDSRIVYVDNDPLVLAHARALLTTSSAEGSTDYIDADLSDPDALLRAAREKLDFSRPVAIMLMGILGHIGNPEEDDDRVAQSIVATLKAALPSGGYLAIYDSAGRVPGSTTRWASTTRPAPSPTACAGRIRSRASSTAWSWSIPASCRSSSGAPTTPRSGRPRT